MVTRASIPLPSSYLSPQGPLFSRADSLELFLSSDAAIALRRVVAWGRAKRRRALSATRGRANRAAEQSAAASPSPLETSAAGGLGTAAASRLARFWASGGIAAGHSARERTALLSAAAEVGAPETAFLLARSLVGDLSHFSRVELARALPPMLNALCTAGEHDLAAHVRGTFAHGLTRRSDGISAFDREDPMCEMSTGAWMLGRNVLNSHLISQFLEAEGRVPRSLHHAFHRAALHFLTSPEVELLLASARSLEPRATSADWEAPVNRLLHFLRLPPVECIGSTENVLASLRSGNPAALAPEQGPLVSVIMAAHNAERTIGYALDSLLSQTYENIEILVCDDASTDGTLSLLKKRYWDHPKVRLFAAESNHGPYNCRNGLLPHVRGECVTFHDADDFALPVRIALQVQAMKAESARACVTDWVRVSPRGVFVFYRDLAAIRLCMPSLMVERTLIERFSGFRCARFGADREFYDRIVDRVGLGGVARIRKPLVFGLSQVGSLTRTAHGQSAASGYRSPARRAYLEICARQRVLGEQALSHEAIDDVLEKSGNLCAPSAVYPVVCGTACRASAA